MEQTSILKVAALFSAALTETVHRSSGVEVSAAKTAQFIPSVQIGLDVGAFVSFHGNYNGLMVLNFDGAAALEIVTSSLKMMGFPADEIPTHHQSDEVRNSLGEMTNHIIGKARNAMQTAFDLTAQATIPAVVPVTTPIGLVFKSTAAENYACVRLAYRTPQRNNFHMELTLEPTLFAKLG